MSGRRPEILDGQVAPAARTAWPRAVFMARPFRSWEGWPSSDGWIRCRLKPGCGSAPEEQPCRLRRQRIAGSGRNICPGAVRFTRSSSHHDQTISFYRDVLGLPVVEEFADSFGEDGTIFGLPDTHVQLEIVRGSRVTSQNPPAHPAGSQGLSAHRLPVMDLWQRLEPCAYVPCRPSTPHASRRTSRAGSPGPGAARPRQADLVQQGPASRRSSWSTAFDAAGGPSPQTPVSSGTGVPITAAAVFHGRPGRHDPAS
jgi:hypothetical protein